MAIQSILFSTWERAEPKGVSQRVSQQFVTDQRRIGEIIGRLGFRIECENVSCQARAQKSERRRVPRTLDLPFFIGTYRKFDCAVNENAMPRAALPWLPILTT